MDADDGRGIREVVTTPLMPGPADPAQIFSQIRANIAFEHMLVAVLIAAAVSGATLLVLNGFFLIAKGAGSVAGLFGIAMDAIYFAFLTFLIGFFASVIVGLPLFMGLEKIKLRKAWPYIVAAVLIEYVAYSAQRGSVLMIDDLAFPTGLVLFLPGVLAGLLFGRRMKPLWQIAERAEKTPAIRIVH